TSFDAGRALVGRGLLDPGRGDPHDRVVLDVEVELTSHGAVRTHRPDDPVRFAERVTAETLFGNELEDGAGGTDSYALAAPGTAGMVRVSIATHDDLSMLAPHRHVENPHLLDVLAGAYAAGAQDTRAHVMLNHHIAGPLVPGAQGQLVVGAHRHLVLYHIALEFVSGMRPHAIASANLAGGPVAAVRSVTAV